MALPLPYPILHHLRDAQENFDALSRQLEQPFDPGTLTLTAIAVTAGGEPPGWLLCDGRAVSRTGYGALFAAVGTRYGSGDGVTTFNLPNFTAAISGVAFLIKT